MFFNTAVTLHYKNTVFTWWERLPAANIALALRCRRFSPAGGVPQRGIAQLNLRYHCSIDGIVKSRFKDWKPAFAGMTSIVSV
jgi:hypothetical protein